MAQRWEALWVGPWERTSGAPAAVAQIARGGNAELVVKCTEAVGTGGDTERHKLENTDTHLTPHGSQSVTTHRGLDRGSGAGLTRRRSGGPRLGQTQT